VRERYHDNFSNIIVTEKDSTNAVTFQFSDLLYFDRVLVASGLFMLMHTFVFDIISSSLFHDLLLRSHLYHWVWSVITAHNLTPEKRDNNYSLHPLTPTSCLRNNIQLITGISPCSGCL